MKRYLYLIIVFYLASSLFPLLSAESNILETIIGEVSNNQDLAQSLIKFHEENSRWPNNISELKKISVINKSNTLEIISHKVKDYGYELEYSDMFNIEDDKTLRLSRKLLISMQNVEGGPKYSVKLLMGNDETSNQPISDDTENLNNILESILNE